MMYRAKITHSAAIIANIYGADYPYYVKDAHDTYIEVKTEIEASTIGLIDAHSEIIYLYVKYLEDNKKL